MAAPRTPADTLTRRRFLRQSFAFSALASLGSFRAFARAVPADPAAAHFLALGDWGYEDDAAQLQVAAGLRAYAKQHSVRVQALLMLGDNWYGELAGGAGSARWKTHFEDLYPAQDFPCPAYAVLGNHDYQRWPESKVDAELEYARNGRSRWTMPARWYRFEFPAKDPTVTFLALDSNMPRTDGKEKSGRDFTLTPEQQAELNEVNRLYDLIVQENLARMTQQKRQQQLESQRSQPSSHDSPDSESPARKLSCGVSWVGRR